MEFTYSGYRHLLSLLAQNGYQCTSYHGWKKKEKAVILRHDIDFDMQKALKMAAFEAAWGGAATYFVMLTSDFYNVFTKESFDILQQIINYGHTIGLHFDEVRYPEYAQDIEGLKQQIVNEIRLLSSAIGQDIKAVSMHRPSQAMLGADLNIPGVTNSYGWQYFREFKYLSDSRRKWREPVEEVIASGSYNRLHILIHPFWYQDTEKNLSDSVSEFVGQAGRARYGYLKSNIRDLESILPLEAGYAGKMR